MNSQKAISLPSSPHEYGSPTPERSGSSNYRISEEMVSTWNSILRSPMFQNKPLLPFEEWNIEFSELTVGTRVGIGKTFSRFSNFYCISVFVSISHIDQVQQGISDEAKSQGTILIFGFAVLYLSKNAKLFFLRSLKCLVRYKLTLLEHIGKIKVPFGKHAFP